MIRLILILLTLSISAQAQQIAIIKTDTVHVKQAPNDSSETISYMYYGQEFEYVDVKNGWALVVGGGYITTEALISRRLFLQQGGIIRRDDLYTKDPNQYTQAELLYMLVQEQRKNEDLRSSIRTIKNVDIARFVTTTIYMIISGVLLVRQL